MKTLSFTLLLITQLCFASKFYGQNIAINEIGNLPDTSAMLDVSSTTKGFLTPRMTTAQQNAIPSPANGLLIYNTSDNTFKVNKGNATAPEWVSINSGGGATTNSLTSTGNTMTSQVNSVTATGVPIVNSNSLLLTGTKLVSTVNGVASAPTELSSLTNIAWNLDGNINTSPATHYLGTRDNNDFIFKTNNVEAMRLTGNGRLLGLNVSNPMYRIQVEDPSGPDADIAARMYNNSDQRYFPSLQLQVSSGTKAAPSPVTNNTILGALHFNGFDGAKFNDVISTGILVRATQNWNTSAHGSFMIFKTIENNTTAEMERMKIDHNGFIGIGTSAPGSALDIKGVLRLSGSGSGFVGLTPAENAGSTTYTLPAADGSNGQLLTTNGTGKLSWSSASNTSDYIPYSGASSNLNLGANALVTTGSIAAGTTSTGMLTTSGNATLGTSTANRLSIQAAIQGTNALVFDGQTSGGAITTLAIAEPTGNNIITLPNTTGTLMTSLMEDPAPGLGGDLMLNHKSINITSQLKEGQSYAGIYETAVVGESVNFGDVLYFDFRTNSWMKANAISARSTPVQRMALEAITGEKPGKLLIEGFVTNEKWVFESSLIFLSAKVVGAITNYQPENAGDQIQRLGIAYGKNRLHFKPSIDVTEVR